MTRQHPARLELMQERYDDLPNDVAQRLEEIDQELIELDRREEDLLEERMELIDDHLGWHDVI